MKILAIVFFSIFSWLQYKVWYSIDGIPNIHHLQRKLEIKREENVRLTNRNVALAAEIQDLKRGYHAIEEHARHDLGMVNQDEILYKLVPEMNEN